MGRPAQNKKLCILKVGTYRTVAFFERGGLLRKGQYKGKYGINVNAVSPGPFPSPTVQQENVFVEELKSKTCLNRIGKPEDLAGAFVFLASGASDFITGHNLVVDGGWTIK